MYSLYLLTFTERRIIGTGPLLILGRIVLPKTRRAVVKVSFVSGTGTRRDVVIVMQAAIT